MVMHTLVDKTHGQRGAALVVGLILMLVLTVLGVSGMTMSVSGLTMASNAQTQQNAFQAAETGIDRMLEQRNFITTGPVVIPMTALGDGSYSVSATQTFQDVTPAPGYSIGEFLAFHFDIRSDGNGPDNAHSIHNQGFYFIGPDN